MKNGIKSYNAFEIELTSHCNLLCPGCTRTHGGKVASGLELTSMPYELFVKTFTPTIIKNKKISFCGVVGDPLMHKDFFEIAKYCVEAGAMMIIDTNGSLRSTAWWKKFGKLSKKYFTTGRNGIKVKFSVDGHRETNHLYRVNSNFDKILENMKAYTTAGGRGEWKYIIFPHNEHELEKAKQEATNLNLKFVTKQNNRTPDESWPTQKIIEQKTQVHKKVEEIKDYNSKDAPILRQQIVQLLNNEKVTDTKKEKVIDCWWLKEQSLFIGFDGRVWPCCYFQDHYHDYYLRPNRSKLYRSTGKYLHHLDQYYGPKWNSIYHKSLEDILKNPFFKSNLKESIDTNPHYSCAFNCAKYV